MNFNVGVNDAEVAGQTIFHYHVHLIPRRKGDTDNPCGGIRGVIEGKSKYLVPIKPNHLIIFITLFWLKVAGRDLAR